MASMDETHVYQREIHEQQRSSLSVLVGMVAPGTSVLDVGIGGGALGAYLSSKKGCTVDGLTYNAEEAEAAASAYQTLTVVDLDTRCLDEVVSDAYDYLVCADVLEHLRDPGRVLSAARGLLKPDGRLLVSVPNVAYFGLVAELLEGEFRYRREGLLDQTHVRFFTRNSLLRFMSECGWQVLRIETVNVDLADSEFAPSLEMLPASVRKQLFANPDGTTYQFIVEAVPLAQGEAARHEVLASPSWKSWAHYVLNLYFADDQGFSESNKVEARARIGEDRQDVVFALPQMSVAALRLDPSDRPGFLHLYAITLCNVAGELVWQWDGDAGSLRESCAEILIVPAWLGATGGALLLTGDDPHIQLPVPAPLLAQAVGGTLRLSLSWPMSADYRVLAESTAPVVKALEQTSSALRMAVHERDVARGELDERNIRLSYRERELQLARDDHASLQDYVQKIENESRKLGEDHVALHAEHVRTRKELIGLSDRFSLAEEDARRCRSERDDIARHIDAIQNSTVFRATRPLVKVKMKLDQILGRKTSMTEDNRAAGGALSPRSPVVDVIVPVYRGLADTRCCVESVLSAPTKTPYRLVLINDCSPEPEVTTYLRSLPERDQRVVLLENEVNLGFVGTVNRGMALDGSNDVLLLNSDAEVANDWLDRIRISAYSGPRVSSVTPLSNNATICSYPKFCADNDLPSGWTTASLDRLAADTNPGSAVEVPTGVGFCMYIRRDSLDDVGLFDVENFGKGYGEENDFCIRAYKRGWRHLLTLDTFVRHAGGVSFGEAKTPREREAVAKLRRLHPEYEPLVHKHVEQDPARVARLRLDLARFRAEGLPAVLAITHSRGGGTDRHVCELAEELAGKLACFALKPLNDGVTELSRVGAQEAFKLGFRLPKDYDELIETLRSLGVAHVHIHHLIGHDPSVWGIAERLGVRYDYTVHDYYAVCPQISLTDHADRYCGEKGIEQCRSCLIKTPAPGGVSIDAWRGNFRSVLDNARYVLCPSADAGTRMGRYVPNAALRVVPHRDLPFEYGEPSPAAIGSRALRVIVIGALSPIKGADILEAVAGLAAEQSLLLDFHLVGYAYRPLQALPKARLTVHGAYQEKDLEDILAMLQPDLVWFPAQWPETYSYTLSACLKAQLPVAVPDIGALPERVAGRAWTWVCPWASTAQEWLNFFELIKREHFSTGVPPQISPGASGASSQFSYQGEYLDAVVAREALPVLSNSLLDTHADMRPTGLAGAEHRARGQVLSAVVRIRNHPSLKSFVKFVPLSLQTRIKLWLLR